MADSGHDAHAPADAPRPGAGHRALRWLIEAAVILVGAVVIATLLRTFVAQMFVIPSTSMENTLQVHDRILVAKFGGFQRGDVVVFEDPGNWLGAPVPNTDGLARVLEFVGVLPDSGTGHLVKRAVGMPGDHVRLNEQGLIEVNGAALDEADYLYARDGVQVAPATVPFDIVVPQGHIFVMGDHRNNSEDSRCRLANGDGSIAFVPVDKVVGAAVAIVSPLERLSTFSVPDSFDDVPDADAPPPERAELINVEPGC